MYDDTRASRVKSEMHLGKSVLIGKPLPWKLTKFLSITTSSFLGPTRSSTLSILLMLKAQPGAAAPLVRRPGR